MHNNIKSKIISTAPPISTAPTKSTESTVSTISTVPPISTAPNVPGTNIGKSGNTTINNRLLSIKKLMEQANLEGSNPLHNVDINMDTEYYTGPKDNKSLDTKTVLNKKSLNLNSFFIVII